LLGLSSAVVIVPESLEAIDYILLPLIPNSPNLGDQVSIFIYARKEA
jgi:hypothetical protein